MRHANKLHFHLLFPFSMEFRLFSTQFQSLSPQVIPLIADIYKSRIYFVQFNWNCEWFFFLLSTTHTHTRARRDDNIFVSQWNRILLSTKRAFDVGANVVQIRTKKKMSYNLKHVSNMQCSNWNRNIKRDTYIIQLQAIFRPTTCRCSFHMHNEQNTTVTALDDIFKWILIKL